jgi:hypothetical protein
VRRFLCEHTSHAHSDSHISDANRESPGVYLVLASPGKYGVNFTAIGVEYWPYAV